jgi:hypothetical protein
MLHDDYDIHEVIEMALSDHTSFKQIESLYGLKEKDVKRLMRQNLKPGSYARLAAPGTRLFRPACPL